MGVKRGEEVAGREVERGSSGDDRGRGESKRGGSAEKWGKLSGRSVRASSLASSSLPSSSMPPVATFTNDVKEFVSDAKSEFIANRKDAFLGAAGRRRKNDTSQC